MAEYYPLLAKAVAGLQNSTPETRRAVYDRAQKALLAQLRSLDPPIAESDVTRETEALAEAVARLEAELTGGSGHAGEEPPAPVSAPRPAPIAAKDARLATSSSTRSAAPTADKLDGGEKAGRPERAAPASPPGSRFAMPPRREPPAGLRPAPPMPKPLRPSPPPSSAGAASGRSAAKLARPAPVEPDQEAAAPAPLELKPSEPKQPEARGAAAERPSLKKPPLPKFADLEPQEREDIGDDLYAAEAEPELPFEETRDWAETPRPRVEAARLYAPQHADAEEKRSSFRLWLVGGIVAVVVAIVAIAAWTLRDRPEDLAKLKPVAQTQAEKGGKIVERVGAGTPEEASSSAGQAESQSATAPAPAPANPAPAQTPSASAAPKPAESAQGVPIAYRAALLVEAPDEPNKVKTYVGTVVWRLDNVSSGSGQPLGTAVHADVDIPSDKLKVGLTLQKNTDPSLPASHTMTIDFIVQPDSASGGIKQISVPELREDDAAKGQSLVGVTVPIMENSFLIGLSRGSAEATNLGLIKSRAWIDIPILLGNGKIAKLTFEKGTSGARAVDDAIAAWQAQ